MRLVILCFAWFCVEFRKISCFDVLYIEQKTSDFMWLVILCFAWFCVEFRKISCFDVLYIEQKNIRVYVTCHFVLCMVLCRISQDFMF
jgi:hypothetical protein